MPKINLTDLSNLQNEVTATAAINNNNTLIEAAIDNSISRDGTQPNQMNSDLDMNSNKIINLPDAASDQEPVTYGQYLEGITSVSNGAVIDGSFVTLGTNPTLLNERVLTAGPSMQIVDGGPGSNVVIGLSSQELAAIAGAGSDADKLPYYDGIGSVELADLSPFARTLLDDTDAVTARATLGVSTGSGDLVAANNLSDVVNPTTALTNLGGLKASNNFSDVSNTTTAITNLGALKASNNLSDVSNSTTALTNLGGVKATNNLSDLANSQTALYNIQGSGKLNRILNSAMRISQANGSTATTVSGANPVDMFRIYASGAVTFTSQQVASVTPAGSPNRIRTTITGADTSIAAGDFLVLGQCIEGYRVADLMWGTANAKPVTISFGVKAPAGTYGISLRNAGNTRSYVTTFVISGGEANTDVRKTVTISGDTSGTWDTTNGIGIFLSWVLTSGSSLNTTAGSWQAGNFFGTSGVSNFSGTVSNVFDLFDVQLCEGLAVPPFEMPMYHDELIRCQRQYYIRRANVINDTFATGMQYTSTLALINFNYPTMRATPNVAISGLGHFTLLVPGNSSVAQSIGYSVPNAESTRLDFGTTALAVGPSMVHMNSLSGFVVADARL